MKYLIHSLRFIELNKKTITKKSIKKLLEVAEKNNFLFERIICWVSHELIDEKTLKKIKCYLMAAKMEKIWTETKTNNIDFIRINKVTESSYQISLEELLNNHPYPK